MQDEKSLTDYIDNVKQSYTPILFVGGNLRPFHLSKNLFQWALFDVELHPGNFRLGLHIVSDWHLRPITAFAVTLPPGDKPMKHANTGRFGTGFNIPPAVSIGNVFLLSRNITDFYTRFNGMHQVGVTTKNWTSDTEKVRFEIVLLKKNLVIF